MSLLLFQIILLVLQIHADAFQPDNEEFDIPEEEDYTVHNKIDEEYFQQNEKISDEPVEDLVGRETIDSLAGDNSDETFNDVHIQRGRQKDARPGFHFSSGRRVCSHRLSRFVKNIFSGMKKEKRQQCSRRIPPCKLSIPNPDEPKHCKIARRRSVLANRQFFKLTRFGDNHVIKFPLTSIPFLNQTMEATKLYTVLDPIDSRWLVLFGTFKKIASKMGTKGAAYFSTNNFTQASDYIKAYAFHKKFIEKLPISTQPYFLNPTLEPTFSDFISKAQYMTDDIFVQRRLAGPCPFLMKLVTLGGAVGFKWEKLKRLLNRKFDFNKALRKVLSGDKATVEEVKMTLEEAVEEEMLFVLYHEENNGMEAIPDYFDVKDRNYLELTSPIALFARTKRGELKVFAIQTDYETTSPVYTPQSDPLRWSLAKSMVNLADFNLCQSVWHLSHLHFSAGVFCTIYRSHFSRLHPLYQLMRHHCQGTTPHISLAWSALTDPHMAGHQFFAIGHTGIVKLTEIGRKQFRYETLDYEHILRTNGLGSDKLPLEYYPFRDDGKEVWTELRNFASDVTRRYYECDAAVASDGELQGFARQISADGGSGDRYGGKGNVAGFPVAFETRKQVATFITRFVWQIVMHGAINYPVEPWGSFIPLTPTKIYDKPTLFESLPDMPTTLGLTSSFALLGSLRINRLFDYHGDIQDGDLKKIVATYHDRFHRCLQPLLEGRNKKRKEANQMGFQYFEPKWITNSIHI